jgi:hypothetical protein
MSPGTEDGNGAGRGAIGVTAGPVAIGRGALPVARGGSVVFAGRRFDGRVFVFAFAFALRAGLAARERPALTFLRRALAARFVAFTARFFALRFFAISPSS